MSDRLETLFIGVGMLIIFLCVAGMVWLAVTDSDEDGETTVSYICADGGMKLIVIESAEGHLALEAVGLWDLGVER